MSRKLKNLVLQLLNGHRVMTIATNRPDGSPKATMVGYVNDGFLLYCFVARNAQKYADILRDPRVSIAIGCDAPRPCDFSGLSLVARATPVADQDEFGYFAALRPSVTLSTRPRRHGLRQMSQHNARRRSLLRKSVVLLRIVPEIISVLDYSKAFGHSDLITLSDRDLDMHLDSRRHHWAESAGTEAEEPDEG